MYKLSPSSTDLSTKDLATLYDMIEKRGTVLDPVEFSQHVCLKDYLSDGEEITEFLRSNSDALFYKVEFNPGEFLYGIQSHGIDTLFTMHGKPVNLESDFDTLLSQEIASDSMGWVLSPCNSIYAREHMGDEFLRFKNKTLQCFDGIDGSSRLQLLRDGTPVSGMEVRDDVITALYTQSSERHKGYEEQLLRHALQIFPKLKNSDFFPDTNLRQEGFAPGPLSLGAYKLSGF